MNTFTNLAGEASMEELANQLPLNIDHDSFSAEQVMSLDKKSLRNFMHSCGACHYNTEGVPPAFLGQKPFAADELLQCQRIQTCAARMLYRLKMRNCNEDQISKSLKNPMPMQNFFESLNIDPELWQRKVAPSLIGYIKKNLDKDNLKSHLLSKNISQINTNLIIKELLDKDCPNIDFTVYETLPLCEFKETQTISAKNIKNCF